MRKLHAFSNLEQSPADTGWHKSSESQPPPPSEAPPPLALSLESEAESLKTARDMDGVLVDWQSFFFFLSLTHATSFSSKEAKLGVVLASANMVLAVSIFAMIELNDKFEMQGASSLD